MTLRVLSRGQGVPVDDTGTQQQRHQWDWALEPPMEGKSPWIPKSKACPEPTGVSVSSYMDLILQAYPEAVVMALWRRL